jgi:hypothetical protein
MQALDDYGRDRTGSYALAVITCEDFLEAGDIQGAFYASK